MLNLPSETLKGQATLNLSETLNIGQLLRLIHKMDLHLSHTLTNFINSIFQCHTISLSNG